MIVWRDPGIHSVENCSHLVAKQSKYQGRIVIVGCENDEKALLTIQTNTPSKVWVISNKSGGGRAFLEKARAAGVTKPCFVFTSDTSDWVDMPGVRASKYQQHFDEFFESVAEA
jgi:hypothetical protein